MGDKPNHALLLGANPAGEQVFLNSRMANRHGIICGATGTGKTVTLQVLAEHFSRLGVPVFTADVKGDLSALAAPGSHSGRLQERLDKIGVADHEFCSSPITFWDVFGKTGHPIRTTLSDFGPLLFANLLDLNDTQTGVIHIAWTVAEDRKLPLLDLKDLREMLSFLGDNAKEIQEEYGNVSKSSIGAIQRRLLELKRSGGEQFFGEPAMDINDLMRVVDGKGVINLLEGRQLMLEPGIYSTLLVWLLTELFKQLPEVGDSEKPKLVFFFDEAHLLFDDAPEVLLEKFEQVVRLIRSKGVGVYFVTQNPADIPDSVLGQCGNRVQHALRAYTPKDRKALKVAAESFRTNPDLDTVEVIAALGVGEALVSTLDLKGAPTVVQQTLLMPPHSQFGPIPAEDREALFKASEIGEKYNESVDRKSAYEILKARKAKEAEQEKSEPPGRRSETGKAGARPKRSSRRQSTFEAGAKSLVRSLGTTLGRTIMYAIMDALGIKRKRRR